MIKYSNEDTFINLLGYDIGRNAVSLTYKNAVENLSGFAIYAPDGAVIKDCSDFKYRWDVLEGNPDKIYYTNIPDNVQAVKFPRINPGYAEPPEPLNNGELTECVAELLYKDSLRDLGMQGGVK